MVMVAGAPWACCKKKRCQRCDDGYRDSVQNVCSDCGKCYGVHCRRAGEEELLPFSALATTVNGKPLYHWTKHHSPQRCYWCNISIAQEDICCSQMCRDSGGLLSRQRRRAA